jgi:serine/threonine protein kinase
MSLAPGQQIGDYLILQELGAGGMGKVYKVQNVISDRLEAMKVLLPDLTRDSDLAERFLREIKVQASLEHPNIARLHTAMRADNQLLMLMEFVEGRTVESLFTPERPMPLDHAVWHCMQVLSALEYAHVRGIVHRDIKPSNMMLTTQGQIKLLDFGIARVINDPSLTQTRQTVGSLFYMSPEQINGQPVDARSDLYSLGVSLYQMVTGRKPFDGTSDFSIMAAHMQQQAIPPIQLDPAMPQLLNDVILRAIAKDVNQRFQSAAEFHAGLEAVLRAIQSGGPAAAAPQPQPQPQAHATPMPPASNSGLGLKLAMVALVVFLVAGGGLAWWKFRKPAALVAETPTTPEPVPSTITPPAPTPTQPVDPKPTEPATVATNPINKPAPNVLPAPMKPQAQPPAAVPGAARVTTPEPTTPEPAPVYTPPAPTPQTQVQPAPPRLHAAVVSELRVRRVRIQSRLEACKAAMNNLRETLASQGLKPRGDIGILLQTVASEVTEAETAIKDADADAAKQHFDTAEQALRKAERFFNL